MQPTLAARSERRLWPRRKKVLSVFVAHPHVDEETPERAWVLDTSPGGIRLSVREAVEKEAVLLVRPASALVDTPWVGVRVKSCQPNDQKHELGCEFILPRWDSHLLFS